MTIAGHGVFPEEGSGFAEHAANHTSLAQRYGPVGIVFPNPQKEKGDCGAAASSLARAGNLGLGLPAEDWADKKNVRAGPDGEPSRSRAKHPDSREQRPSR